MRVGPRLCALPIEHVDETMRPQPLRAVAGAPRFVLGQAVIRGAPVPVVDAVSVLGAEAPSPSVTRFVTLRTGDRRVALAVDRVLGVRQIDDARFLNLPPLLSAAADTVVSGLAAIDAALPPILRIGRLVPPAVWAEMEGADS